MTLPFLPNDPVTDLSIILVCWNNKDYLEPCLQSLYVGGPGCKFDVIVVDNGSTDGSLEMLADKFPQVKLICNDHNAGLSKASNQGITASCGRYILLLNNDTIVNGPSLQAMVEFLDRNPGAGAVGGRLLNPDGSFQAGGSNFPSLHEEFLIATRLGTLFRPGYPDSPPPDEICQVNWLGSACLTLRREALNRVGLLDEDYFIYGDEADLQFRIKRAGWKVYFLPNVTTIHYGGRSMDRWKRRKMVYRGKMLFFRKNFGHIRSGLLRSMLAGLSIMKSLLWGIAWFRTSWRNRARKELHSNFEVIKLCVKLE